MFEFFLNLSFSYLTYLTFRKLRLVKVFLFLFEVRFFDLNWSLVWNDFLLGLKLNFVHFLFKGFHLIVKYDFLGLIIKVFSDFFDVNFDGFVCSFLHDFKIILIGEGDFVIFFINIVKLVFAWKLFKNISDVGDEGSKWCLLFWVEDVDLLVVDDFEKHKLLLKIIIIMN